MRGWVEMRAGKFRRALQAELGTRAKVLEWETGSVCKGLEGQQVGRGAIGHSQGVQGLTDACWGLELYSGSKGILIKYKGGQSRSSMIRLAFWSSVASVWLLFWKGAKVPEGDRLGATEGAQAAGPGGFPLDGSNGNEELSMFARYLGGKIQWTW